MRYDPSNPRNRGSRIVGKIKIGSIETEIPIAWSRDDSIFMEEFLKNTKNGWVFIDNQININRLGMNTVIFDYNALNGQLYDHLNNSLHTPEVNESLNIRITTPEEKMKFRICSVYHKKFDDWKSYRQFFHEEKDRHEFVDHLRHKNELKRLENTEVSIYHNFLTISVFQKTNEKGCNLIVQARLITEDE
ncbi:hypothetical protein [uncultured Brevibacillus sp.]|uniref:hypothetical protein n=1 Tax=uncultured Brevibacillus sp. TaxID=169970 RepID=UPI0025923EE3|nr:hypothetical protein [uncultured Brevibacillus sp.]